MTLASKITLARILLIPLFMVFMYLSGGQQGVWLWVAFGTFILASITDYVDGEIARRMNQITDFGKFLDPLADKVLVMAALVIFTEWQWFPSWALMVVLTRELAVTGLRLVSAGKGKVIAAGWSGKIKTASTMVGICVMMAFPAQIWLRWVAIVVIVGTTLYSGVEYFIQNINCIWNRE